MHLQDNYSYGKILDKKKYLEAKDVDFNLPDPSRPLKDSQAKLAKLRLTENSPKTHRQTNQNPLSARESDAGFTSHRASKIGLSSNDRSGYTLPLLEKSLLSNRSLLSGKHTRSWYQSASKLSIVVGSEYDESGLSNLSSILSAPKIVSEFSEKYLDQLSSRIDTLPSEYGEIDKPLEKAEDVDLLLMKLNAKDQAYSPIRLIHANSNIGLDCTKNIRQYFKVKCDGYKFPMKINFSKRNLHMMIYISFVHRRPDELRNEYQSQKHTFEVPLSAMWSSSSQPPPGGEMKASAVYLCIVPEGDFKDTMSVTFEARDTKQPNEVAATTNRDEVDYKGLLKFSEQFNRNVNTLTYYQKLEARKEKLRAQNKSKDSAGGDDENNTSQNAGSRVLNRSVLSNSSLYDPDMLVDYKKKREMKILQMSRLDDERRDLAKVKTKMLQRLREEEILERKSAREGSILNKRELIEGMLSCLVSKTRVRSWIAHMYLIRFAESVSKKVQEIKTQREFSMKKFHASMMLVRAFKRFIRSRQKEKFVTITEETPKEVKFHKVNIKDAQCTLMLTHMWCKELRWTKIIPKAMENLGLFYKSVARGWIMSDKFFDFRRRIINLQKSFRNFKYIKRVYIQHCAPILVEAVEDIKRIGESRKIAAFKLKGGLQHTPEEIVNYLFEYHMLCYVREKYAKSELEYKEFKTLASKVEDLRYAVFKEGAKLEYTNSGLNSQKYSKIINPKRQKDMKDEISLVDPTIITMKSKQREEQLKKLKVVLKLVCDKLEGSKRFVFDFNEVSARLFLVGYFQLHKVPELLAVHEICSNSKTFEQDLDAGQSPVEEPEHAQTH